MNDFLEEVSAFPAYATDDQVDAMTQALDHFSLGVRPRIISLKGAR